MYNGHIGGIAVSRFCYDKSNYHNHVHGVYCDIRNNVLEVTLSNLLADLFKGQYKSRIVRQRKGEDYVAYEDRCKALQSDVNDALFIAKGTTLSTNEEFYDCLFPPSVVGTSRKNNPWSGSQIRAFVGRSANYGPGDGVLRSLAQQPDRTIADMAQACAKLFDREHYEYDEAAVVAYFEGWKEDTLFADMSDLSQTYVDMFDSAFCQLLSQKRYDLLLARILLTMVAALKPQKDTRHFLIGGTHLKLIWFSADQLDTSDINVAVIEPQMLLNICELWCEDGRHEEAFRILTALAAHERFAEIDAECRARCLCMTAQLLLHGDGCDKQVARAVKLLESCCDHAHAQYLLSGCYRGVYDASLEDHTRAAGYMLRAAELGHVQAMMDLIKHCLVPSTPLYEALWSREDCRRVDRYEKARVLLDTVERGDAAHRLRATLLYLRGLLFEHDNRLADAENAFKEALRLGNNEAIKKLRHTKRDPRMVRPQGPIYDCSAIDFLINDSSSPLSSLFVSSLKGETLTVYSTCACCAKEAAVTPVDGIRAFLERTGLTAEQIDPDSMMRRRVAAFFSDDEDKNLYDALELLDLLYNVVIEQEPSVREQLIDHVDIYLLCDYRRAAMFIDANLNDMLENVFFKVHICDPARDAAHQLLHQVPLFVPLLRDPKADSCHVVVLSDTPFADTFLRETIAVGFMGRQREVDVDVLTPDAARRQARFYADLPGLYKQTVASPTLRTVIPQFHEADFDIFNPTAVIADRTHPLHDAVTAGDYFVIDVGTDAQNIRVAIQLRQELLKSVAGMDKVPTIAVRCRDARAAHSVDTAMLGNKPQGSDFWDQYDLHMFGTYDTMYAVYPLVMDAPLDKLALALHCCYDEASFSRHPQDVLAGFYRSQYNQDSSLVTALSLRYRLFTAGVYADKQELVFDIDEDEMLAARYDEWLRDGHLEEAGAIEQSRWNGFMLSRGWEAATLAQVQVYAVQTANGQHRHMLAKLHPFICEWEELDETDHTTIFSNLKNAFGTDDAGDYLIKNPKDTTLKSVADTGAALRMVTKMRRKEAVR